MIEEKKIEVDGFVTSDGEEFINESSANRHEDRLNDVRKIQKDLGNISFSEVISVIKEHPDIFENITTLVGYTHTRERLNRIVDFVEKEQGINKD